MDENESGDSGIDSKASTKTVRSIRRKVYLNELAKRKAIGIREEISFNARGQPFGASASEMQSFIGVLARKEIKIIYKTWKDVPVEAKEFIWDSVNVSYKVIPTWKAGCLESANAKWRQHKSKLYTEYILPNKDNPSILNDPPPFSGILLEDWSRFVKTRLSDDFKKLSEKQREIQKQNIFPHRLSRAGYVGLAEKMKEELCGDNDIDRAVMWKKARVPKNKVIESDELKKVMQRIDDCIAQKKDGKFKSKGLGEDLLTCALESREHAGRVRAIGSYVTPTEFFKYSREDRRLSQILQKDAELVEAKTEIREQKTMIDELFSRIATLEADMKKGKEKETEEKGSCLVKTSRFSKCQLKDRDDEDESDDVKCVEKPQALEGKSISLMSNTPNVIVAYGTLVGPHGENNILHGCPMPKDCARVSIDEAVKPDNLLPHPTNECTTVGDAVGSYVAWPIHLLAEKMKVPLSKKAQGKQVVKKKLIKTYESLNSSLKALYWYAEGEMKNGEKISIELDGDVFGRQCEINVHLQDILSFCELEPISGNCIVVYIWHLYRQMAKASTLGGFRFVNPFKVSYAGKSYNDGRIQFLAERLEGVCQDQLVLVPCNIGNHWILTVIDPHKEVIYWLDPLYHRIRDGTWKNVVDMAMKVFNASLGRKGKTHLTWEIIKNPLQPDGKQCGFYVMRFMKDIVEGLSKTDSIKSLFKKDKYPYVEIEQIRIEWANCLLDYL